jgi:hypothetical protein
MPEHQEQKATITYFVPAALRRINQPFDFARGEVIPFAAVDLAPQCPPFFAFRRSIVLSRVLPFRDETREIVAPYS